MHILCKTRRKMNCESKKREGIGESKAREKSHKKKRTGKAADAKDPLPLQDETQANSEAMVEAEAQDTD